MLKISWRRSVSTFIVLILITSCLGECRGQTGLAGSSDSNLAISQQLWKKDADLGRLGLITLSANSRYAVPAILEEKTHVLGSLDLRVRHTLKSNYQFDPLLIQVEGSSTDIRAIHAGENELGQIKINFSGLLLNGLPQYLEAKAGEYFREHHIEFANDSSSTSHATLTRAVKINIDEEQLKRINDLERRMADLRNRWERSGALNELEIEKNEYIELKESLSKILKDISRTDIPCFPSITKVIKFPIWEKGVDESTSGGSSSATASAKIGVSGDVVINIAPHCSIAIGSNATLDICLEVDVVVQSHGFFGVRTDAAASTELKYEFRSSELGNHRMSTDLIGEKEREILKQLVLDSLISAKDAREVNSALLSAVKNSTIFADARTTILEDLIGTRDAPASTEKLCRIFNTLGRSPGSSADLICRYANALTPVEPILDLPVFIEPSLPPMPIKPNVVCLPQIPVPECNLLAVQLPQPNHPCMVSRSVNISYPCPTWRNPRKVCHRTVTKDFPSMCPTAPIVVPQWVPAGCKIAVESVHEQNRLLRSSCNELANWQNQVNNWQSMVDRIRADALRKHEERLAQLRADFEIKWNQFTFDRLNFDRYRSKDVIFKTALDFAQSNILLSEVSDALAQKIVDQAWALGEEADKKIDYVSCFVRPEFSGYLTLQAKGSARLAFSSTAHLLEINPRIEESLGYRYSSEKKKGELCGTFRFFQHSNPNNDYKKQARIGGLDVLGMVIAIENTLSFAGEDRSYKYSKQVFDSKTLAYPVEIKKEPIEKAFALDVSNLIPQK
jgi:hypothetical protein